MPADLYVSPVSAERAGRKAIEARKADAFVVRPDRQRNDDRSWDSGFVAVLVRAGREIGFA